jgi:hypothetical protein
MNALTRDCTTLMVRELDALGAELDLFPDDVMPWRTMPGVSNSAANLALHVAGNLQHFVGAVLGNTGYVRNRDLEFSRASGSRAEVKQELEAAKRAVRETMPTLTDVILASDYPLRMIEGKRIETGFFLHHLCAHASFHLGQAGYLRRALTGDARSAGPLSLASIMADRG